MSRDLGEEYVFAIATWRLLAHEKKVQWETHVEGIRIVNLLDISGRQLEREGSDVPVQVPNLAAANDREDVWRLVEDVGKTIFGKVSF